MSANANAPTYKIRTIQDFLLVPADRLEECLREFAIMLGMARVATGLLGWELGDTFTWIDDNAGTATMRIRTGDEVVGKVDLGSTFPE